MKIRKSELPRQSQAACYLPVDFHDCFTCTTDRAQTLTPDDLMVAFWTTRPKWLATLFKIRNILVRPFGLKSGEADAGELEEAIRNGRDYQLMSVVEKTPRETIISLEDKHLKAWFSVYIEGTESSNIYLSTLVKFHNRLGVAYFLVIRPFHAMIVKRIFAQVMRKYDSQE